MNASNDNAGNVPPGTAIDPRTGLPLPNNADAAPFERWLDRKLKSVYGSVLEEPIPQDILDLLKRRLDGT